MEDSSQRTSRPFPQHPKVWPGPWSRKSWQVSAKIDFKEAGHYLYYHRPAVLNSSPRAPPLCIFGMLLLSLQMFVLLERKCPANWTSQDIPPWFQFEANVFHSKCIEVCKTWIKMLYIYRGIWCHTRPCVKMLRSADVAQIHEWMFRNKVNFSGFHLLRE